MRRLAILVSILVLALLALWFTRPPKPPDLSGCTRIEIRYERGALGQFVPGAPVQEGLLNQSEKDYARSFDTWTLTDPESIKTFARRVSEGVYWRTAPESIMTRAVYVTGYGEDNRAVPFAIHNAIVMAEGQRVFRYPLRLADLPAVMPPEMKPLKARWDCAFNLFLLRAEGILRPKPGLPYPDPNRWCDAAVETFRSYPDSYPNQDGTRERLYSDAAIARIFACPSAHPSTDADPTSRNWTSDYAMNPCCEPNSAGDVVFLFESKPGWNQHGGPELFSFDNHDPKGGCVKLHDGTVKFVRTEEELTQLRWKP